MTSSTTGSRLAQIVHGAVLKLKQLTPDQYSNRPQPGKWSPKELLGHLIDSAANNHQRFVRAQLQANLVFQGYAQVEWVTLQGYQEQEWEALVDFWASYNLHLAKIIDRIPDEVRLKEHTDHSLHQIAWKTIPADQTATLEYFMQDYVRHLEHHLRQIMPEYELQFDKL